MHRLFSRVNGFSGQLKSPAALKRCVSSFKVVEHIVPCQHTRHYLGGAEPEYENNLKLAVKQYIPEGHNQTSIGPDSVTLIGAHANGFPKEMYEPMWVELIKQLDEKGKQVRSIWVADMAPQGQSGILNESILGSDPSWYDHARDLLFLINQKQGDMPQPLMGIGHSVGAAHLTLLSFMHPRLLQAIVLIDPVIQLTNPSMAFAPASTYRRDIWPSRDEAAAAFRKSKFYQAWDERVLNKWIEYGLRDLPTELYPDTGAAHQGQAPVTLTTSRPQEVFQYLRPLYKSDPWNDKELYADFDPEVLEGHKHFYRPEPRAISLRLPEVYPAVQYIFGASSPVSTPELRRDKIETTGTGIGGNGGVATNSVSEVVLEGGHLLAFEQPAQCATKAAEFFTEQLDKWMERRDRHSELRNAKLRRERADIDEDWRRYIGPPPERPKKKPGSTTAP